MGRGRSRLGACLALLVTALVLASAGPAAARTSFSVTTTAPANGAQVAGSIVWTATVNGGTPSKVDFVVDGNVKYTATSAPYRYNGSAGLLDTTKLANATHTLRVVA